MIGVSSMVKISSMRKHTCTTPEGSWSGGCGDACPALEAVLQEHLLLTREKEAMTVNESYMPGCRN